MSASSSLEPFRLEPQFVPRIWGARSLAPLYPEKADLSEPVGEVWLTGDNCVCTNGPWAGRTLLDAWRDMPAAWAGTRFPPPPRDKRVPFPLLVKFLFPEDVLSVQVHPDDDYAAKHEAATGWTGKTEMWYAHAAREGAEVLVGLKPEVTPDSFRRAIADGTAENCLLRHPLRAGDVMFVPAGTVHTIGPGLVLCEIQENSDLTYRVFDYNRVDSRGTPRPLHIEKALAVARFGPQTGTRMRPIFHAQPGLRETYYVACKHFVTERWEFSADVAGVTQPERFELLIFLNGAGRIEWRGQRAEFAPAQAWLLPAALGSYVLVPDTPAALLRTYVPSLPGDIRERLRDLHVPESESSRIIFP